MSITQDIHSGSPPPCLLYHKPSLTRTIHYSIHPALLSQRAMCQRPTVPSQCGTHAQVWHNQLHTTISVCASKVKAGKQLQPAQPPMWHDTFHMTLPGSKVPECTTATNTHQQRSVLCPVHDAHSSCSRVRMGYSHSKVAPFHTLQVGGSQSTNHSTLQLNLGRHKPKTEVR